MNTLSSLLSFIGSFEPVGSVKMYAGSSAPSKWLFCQGQAVSRTTYAKLFNVIGTTYGAGDGSTTFNLPNFNGRTPIGVGTSGTTGASSHALASTGGQETHAHTTGNFTLTTSHIPAHTHGNKSLTGALYAYSWDDGTSGGIVSKTVTAKNFGTPPSGAQIGHINYAINASHEHTSVGGGQAHNHGNTGSSSQMNPYLTVNFIIFAGV